ncbi:hypothetical protein METBIDRAFT_9296 [Metschnikowia bicuspidata var. bicuspidata NRRL YB-4993]|uniref:Uncharacterized protein n=1 Tax=Metschnikowia bicuspidata var. bicuspidata NRRL YB-4993 TaxID=869754 RepID=A0A1A0HG29_9ASCO|nr:hypothetical protein METBIDRAFT_9296 [Metschnikowia bicuspidata var. bicuspidata NRRL YB-4993]OBA22956.1 hypothetical protein METBIDRAFT_9296 [Metschnikowia bicuspidata var. bicuspidata NRRL YB-4993]
MAFAITSLENKDIDSIVLPTVPNEDIELITLPLSASAEIEFASPLSPGEDMEITLPLDSREDIEILLPLDSNEDIDLALTLDSSEDNGIITLPLYSLGEIKISLLPTVQSKDAETLTRKVSKKSHTARSPRKQSSQFAVRSGFRSTRLANSGSLLSRRRRKSAKSVSSNSERCGTLGHLTNISITTAFRQHLKKVFIKTDQKINNYFIAHFKYNDGNFRKNWRELIYRIRYGPNQLILSYSIILPGTDKYKHRLWKGEWIDISGKNLSVLYRSSVQSGAPSLGKLFINMIKKLKNVSQVKGYNGKFIEQNAVLTPNIIYSRIPRLFNILKKCLAWRRVKGKANMSAEEFQNTPIVDNVTLLMEALDRADGNVGPSCVSIIRPERSTNSAKREISETFVTILSHDLDNFVTDSPFKAGFRSSSNMATEPANHKRRYMWGDSPIEPLEGIQSTHSHSSTGSEYRKNSSAEDSCDLYYMSSNDDSSYHDWKKPEPYASSFKPLSLAEISLLASSVIDWRSSGRSSFNSGLPSLTIRLGSEYSALLEEPSDRCLRNMFRALLLEKENET